MNQKKKKKRKLSDQISFGPYNILRTDQLLRSRELSNGTSTLFRKNEMAFLVLVLMVWFVFLKNFKKKLVTSVCGLFRLL